MFINQLNMFINYQIAAKDDPPVVLEELRES